MLLQRNHRKKVCGGGGWSESRAPCLPPCASCSFLTAAWPGGSAPAAGQMFETASLLEGCDKALESWMTRICQQSIIFFFFPYSIILYLMSLFSVPELPSVYYCSFLPSVFFNSNDILLLRLFFIVDTAFPNLRCLGRGWGVWRGEVREQRREGEAE